MTYSIFMILQKKTLSLISVPENHQCKKVTEKNVVQIVRIIQINHDYVDECADDDDVVCVNRPDYFL